MSTNPIALPPLSDQELDELADFLDTDRVPEEAMDISMLHGFLTAIALCPRPIDAGEWLPMVWGEDLQQPQYESAEHKARIESLLQRLLAQIVPSIDAHEYAPILYVDENDRLDIARPWCFGFTHGIWLQEDAWSGLLEDEEAGALMEPVFDCADEEARDALSAEGEDLAQWEHDIAEAIPDIVAEIRIFHQSQH